MNPVTACVDEVLDICREQSEALRGNGNVSRSEIIDTAALRRFSEHLRLSTDLWDPSRVGDAPADADIVVNASPAAAMHLAREFWSSRKAAASTAVVFAVKVGVITADTIRDNYALSSRSVTGILAAWSNAGFIVPVGVKKGRYKSYDRASLCRTLLLHDRPVWVVDWYRLLPALASFAIHVETARAKGLSESSAPVRVAVEVACRALQNSCLLSDDAFGPAPSVLRMRTLFESARTFCNKDA